MHASRTNKGVITFVEKDQKGMGGLKKQSNNVYNRLLGGLLHHTGHIGVDLIAYIKNNAMMQAGLLFTLQCAGLAAIIFYGSWGFFCWALNLPNPLRALMIWGFLILLSIARQNVNPQGRC